MSETWTTKRLLEWTTEHLKSRGIESARLEAEILLAAALSCKRIDLYTSFDVEPQEDKKTIFRDFVKRRATGEPVAYLVGYKEFYSLKLSVNRNTLIPRPETELIVVEALDFLKKRNAPAPVVCDVGTGSGAIAIAVAKHAPTCRMIAVDRSDEALSVAKQNVQAHQLPDRIVLRNSDLLDQIEESFDLIVSNPPYISETEYDQLPPDVKNYEPKAALLGGKIGTEIIKRLIPQAESRLKKGGGILLEVSPMIADAVAALFPANHWTNLRIIKDLAGLNRIVSAQKSESK